MRSLLSWVMVLFVLAGLNARVLAAPSHPELTHSHEEKACDGHHHHHHCEDDSDGHHQHHHEDGEKCPADHHHHHTGCCVHGSPLAMNNDLGCHVGVLVGRLVGIRQDGEIVPEGPFLSSEKPPLI